MLGLKSVLNLCAEALVGEPKRYLWGDLVEFVGQWMEYKIERKIVYHEVK